MPEPRKVITTLPENSETPLDKIRSWVTPTPWFFVRNHFDVPTLDLDSWRLSIEGCVVRPVELTWEELTSLPERTVFATVECAGNGRSYLQPQAHGVQWGAGAIGHAEWTGVPVRWVLEKAGIKPDALEVVFAGADCGTESDHPETMSFARSLPLAKALDLNTLLAFRMNGEPLEPNHGFPVRLIVPGWYGVASVKWLTRLDLVTRPFRGYFQTKKYTVQRRIAGRSETVIVQEMIVKSEILRPREGDVLGVGANRLFGIAWAGEEAIARVEVSTDNDRSWQDAALIGPSAPYSWTLWEYLWEVANPGPYSLLARATSSDGSVQPVRHNPLDGGYLIHHSRPTRVTVEPTRQSTDLGADADTFLYDMNAYAEANSRFPLDVEMEYSQGGGI